MASLDERGLLRTAKSCGPGTPTLVSSFAEVFREATVAKEPGHRGERGVTVKTNAQGMSGCFGVPVVTIARALFCCVRGCGCIVHPAFPAPSIFRGTLSCKARARSASRQCEAAFGRCHCEERLRRRALHHTLRGTAASMNFAPWHYPSNTASAPFTASALSVTVFSSEAACTEMFSAKNLASVI